ncbi:MAG: J domain-containing protein [Candidatus ainarchaeum sp.]|nr:J domain-containing protein [Candidatus ainarchaeum sp.]
MNTVKIKGYEIDLIPITSSHNRRAVQLKNKIIDTLKLIEIKRDDVDIPVEGQTIRKEKAVATWYGFGYKMHFEVKTQERLIDNLYLLSKVIENEVEKVKNNEKSIEEFIGEFKENDDVHDERKEAREFFGLDHKHKDLDTINKKYKELAKELHPDKPTGSMEKFKELNHHHKVLKRELE